MEKNKSIKVLTKLAKRLEGIEQSEMANTVKGLIKKYSQDDSDLFPALKPNLKIINVSDGLWGYNIDTETCEIRVATAPQKNAKSIGAVISKTRFPDSYDKILDMAKDQGHNIRCSKAGSRVQPMAATPIPTEAPTEVPTPAATEPTQTPAEESAMPSTSQEWQHDGVAYYIKEVGGIRCLVKKKSPGIAGMIPFIGLREFIVWPPNKAEAITTEGLISKVEVKDILNSAPESMKSDQLFGAFLRQFYVTYFPQELAALRSASNPAKDKLSEASMESDSIKKIAAMKELYDQAILFSDKAPFGRSKKG